MHHNVFPAAAVRDLLVVVFLSFIVCRFGEYQPPETTRIARLTASLGKVTFTENMFSIQGNNIGLPCPGKLNMNLSQMY